MESFSSVAVQSPLPPPPVQRPEIHPFAFLGSGTAFFALVIKNMLLSLVTLGLYLPWAKTERRKYLWQNIEIAGHRLRYHGTGKELAIGYAKVIGGYLLFVGLPVAAQRVFGAGAVVFVQLPLTLALLGVVPFAVWGARRYLLSRTSWRGVRFRLSDGSGAEAKRFARTFLLGYLATIFSFGLYAPVWINRMRTIMTNASALGTTSFQYRGEDKVVFKMAMRALPLILITFGIYYFWYLAKLSRYQLQNTWFDGAHGELDLSGGELLKLILLQLFGVTLSLGLAFPWITSYVLRFYLSRLRFVGPIAFEHIHRADSAGEAAADGLADALDVGIAL